MRAFLRRVLILGLSALVLMGWVLAEPLDVRTQQKGTTPAALRAVQNTSPQRNDSATFRRVIGTTIHRPAGKYTAVVAFSAECLHSGGRAGDYTSVKAVLNAELPGGPAGCDDCSRRASVALNPKAGKNLRFCSDSGSSRGLPTSTSFHWTGSMPGGQSRIAIKFASLGGGAGFARLDDMSLTLTVFHAPD